jgi:hypothetical protein
MVHLKKNIGVNVGVLAILLTIFIAEAKELSIDPITTGTEQYTCWVACAQMLLNYFEKAVSYEQIKALGPGGDQPNTLINAASGFSVEQILKKYNILTIWRGSGAMAWNLLCSNIDYNVPIMAGLVGKGVINHMVLIIGYDPNTNYVLYNDPNPTVGWGELSYATFCSNSSYEWTEYLYPINGPTSISFLSRQMRFGTISR